MSGSDEELSPSAQRLASEVQVAHYVTEVFYRLWIEHYYGEEEPSVSGQAYRDAKEVIDVNSPKWGQSSKEDREHALGFLLAVQRCQEAIDTLATEVSDSHPELLEDMNRRIREFRGNEDLPNLGM